MEAKIRAAIVGYGRSGQFLHGRGLQENADSFEVAAVSDVSESCLAQAKEDFGCAVHSDYREMLAGHDFDLVVIVTRNDQHCSMARDALAAGAHVLVTKPLGINAEEATKIYGAARSHGRKVFPFLPARWGTDFRRIREIVESGGIGEVFAIHRAVYGFATRDDWQTRKEFGGGILLNWGAHLIDPPMLLAGGRPAHVFGSCRQLLNGGDAEDVFYSVVTMDNGARVQSEWSFAPQGLANWFVQGTGGCIIGNDTTLEIVSGKPARPADPTRYKDMEGDGTSRRTETVGDDIYGDPVEIYRDIAADLKGGAAYPVTEEESIRLLKIMDAIQESQATQTLIPLS